MNCAFAINHHPGNWLQKVIVIQNITCVCVCVLWLFFFFEREKRWGKWGYCCIIETAITATAIATVTTVATAAIILLHFFYSCSLILLLTTLNRTIKLSFPLENLFLSSHRIFLHPTQYRRKIYNQVASQIN